MFELLNQIFMNYGLFGIFILMFLNMLIFIPPSEIILPLAGFFAYTSGSSLLLVFGISLLANFLGTYVWYFIGRKIGYKRLLKINYFKKREKSLDIIAKKFRKDESYWVGIFRIFPYFRATVSIPAGMVKMPHKYFAI
ncbi:MAG: DedA family protein [archaeon]